MLLLAYHIHEIWLHVLYILDRSMIGQLSALSSDRVIVLQRIHISHDCWSHTSQHITCPGCSTYSLLQTVCMPTQRPHRFIHHIGSDVPWHCPHCSSDSIVRIKCVRTTPQFIVGVWVCACSCASVCVCAVCTWKILDCNWKPAGNACRPSHNSVFWVSAVETFCNGFHISFNWNNPICHTARYRTPNNTTEKHTPQTARRHVVCLLG